MQFLFNWHKNTISDFFKRESTSTLFYPSTEMPGFLAC